MVNFTRNWTEYSEGFGDLTGEFWLGNEKLRRLTEKGNWQMLVELDTSDLHELAREPVFYQSFSITGDKYTLHVDGYKSFPEYLRAGKNNTFFRYH